MRLTHNSSALLTVPTRPSRRFQAGPIFSKSFAMGLLRAYKAPWSSARSPPKDCVFAAIAARTALHEASSARGNATTVLKPRGGSAPASRQAFSCCGSVTTSPRGDLAWAGAGGAALSSSSRFMAQRRQGRALLGWRAGLPGIRGWRARCLGLQPCGGPSSRRRALRATGEAGEADFSQLAPAMPALECLKITSLWEPRKLLASYRDASKIWSRLR